MPIMNPNIQKALQEAGLTSQEKPNSLAEKLDEAGLGLEGILANVARLAECGDGDHLRLRANEMALKMHGVLKDQASPPPTVNIIIQDPNAPTGVNPILLPRQLNQTQRKDPS